MNTADASQAADQFVYTAPAPPPAPTVTGVSPSSGPMAGGAYVTINGANFTGATSVSFGGAADDALRKVDPAAAAKAGLP